MHIQYLYSKNPEIQTQYKVQRERDAVRECFFYFNSILSVARVLFKTKKIDT